MRSGRIRWALGTGWLTEGTAVWMEGQVYPKTRAGDEFLDASPLTDPEISLDAADRRRDQPSLLPLQYGAWVFWQFVSESRGKSVVRDIWSTARKQPDRGRRALIRMLNPILGSFADAFAEFGAWNYAISPGFYEDDRRYLGRHLEESAP